jgi:hypothetical protein
VATRPRDAIWQSAAASFLPTETELAHYLAEQSAFPSDRPLALAEVAQYYQIVAGRVPLMRRLHDIFDRDYAVTQLHSFLADTDVPLLIVTTNYDDLIERAFMEKNRPYDLVTYTSDLEIGDHLLWQPNGESNPVEINPNKLDIDLQNTTVIYKMYGSVDRRDLRLDQYVITEDDYIDFLARLTKNRAIPAIFAEPFQTRPFLYLGYSLRDWNMRVVLNRIERDFRRPRNIRGWAIQYNPTPLEQRFWQERAVAVYDLVIEEFVRQLGSI